MLRLAIIDDEEETRQIMVSFIDWETYGTVSYTHLPRPAVPWPSRGCTPTGLYAFQDQRDGSLHSGE